MKKITSKSHIYIYTLQFDPSTNSTLGVAVSRGVFPEAKWYWIGLGALFGYVALFNFLFTVALAYLDRKYPSPGINRHRKRDLFERFTWSHSDSCTEYPRACSILKGPSLGVRGNPEGEERKLDRGTNRRPIFQRKDSEFPRSIQG